jgi:bifunctional DNA-binding transcriptional regulator/antitoxin component of YhaV-PrlF toxin-antitoxin module
MPVIIPIDQIVIPTSRWQVTIPKKIREEAGLAERFPLNVSSDNGKITMVPVKKMVKEDVWTEKRRKKLLKALEEVRGIWAKDWPEIKKKLAKQRKIEFKAAREMRKVW